MSEKLIHFPVYIGEALKKFIEHPTLEERGAWFVLQVALIENDGILADDDSLYNKCLCFVDHDKQVIKRMLGKCLKKCDEGWFSDDVNLLIEKQKKLRDTRRRAGSAGGKKSRRGKQSLSKEEANDKQKVSNCLSKEEAKNKQSESESESELESNSESSNLSKKYFFELDIIKLNEKDFNQWRKSYWRITDIKPHLQACEDWVKCSGKKDKWFITASNWLRKEHERIQAQFRDDGIC